MADPGFPQGGAPTPRGGGGGGGRQHTILPNFPGNCMKLKEFVRIFGWRVPLAPLDPPLIRVNFFSKSMQYDPLDAKWYKMSDFE